MEHSELFLLLPVYEEAEGQPPYLKATSLEDVSFYRKMVYAVNDMSAFFCYENYEGYYDSENLKAFMMPVDALDDCYPKLSTAVRRCVTNMGSDWRRGKTVSGQEPCSVLGMLVCDDTFSEIANRQRNNPGNSYLLLDGDALVHFDKSVRVACREMVNFVACSTLEIKDIADWFEANRKPARRFHLSEKHGENGKGAHPEHRGEKVSLLLCSEAEAARLLDKAISESADSKILYFKDEKRGAYIEFKGERNNVFHGFHVDADDEKTRISAAVRAKIEKVL